MQAADCVTESTWGKIVNLGQLAVLLHTLPATLVHKTGHRVTVRQAMKTLRADGFRRYLGLVLPTPAR